MHCCQLFQVSRSGYYDCLKCGPSQHECHNRGLDEEIKVLFAEHKQRAGSPRITRDLHTEGFGCSENRVARRMKALGLRALAKRKIKVTTDSDHNKPLYGNVLDRDFSTTEVNQKWAQDITYMKTALVCDALMMALHSSSYPKQVIVHSDRGSQYCSTRYRKLIENHQLIGSMSRKGNCWDNAIAESLFHYIESYYNRKRRHPAIGYQVPMQFGMAV